MFQIFRKYPKVVLGVVSSTIIMTASFIQPYEGRKLIAYLDPVQIPTICSGITMIDGKPVKLGTKLTSPACDALEQAEVSKALKVVEARVGHPLPQEILIATGSLVYNIGPAAFNKSSIAFFLENRMYFEACHAFTKYICVTVGNGRGVVDPKQPCYSKLGNKAPLPGLVTRRNAERDLCLKGIKNAK